jgi:hypothetical protein
MGGSVPADVRDMRRATTATQEIQGANRRSGAEGRVRSRVLMGGNQLSSNAHRSPVLGYAYRRSVQALSLRSPWESHPACLHSLSGPPPEPMIAIRRIGAIAACTHQCCS